MSGAFHVDPVVVLHVRRLDRTLRENESPEPMLRRQDVTDTIDGEGDWNTPELGNGCDRGFTNHSRPSSFR